MSIKERSNQPGWRLYHQYQNTIKLAERLGFRIDRAQFAEYYKASNKGIIVG